MSCCGCASFETLSGMTAQIVALPVSDPAPICLLCGEAGRVLYSDLRDRFWGVPGAWAIRECHLCGVIWLDPAPRARETAYLYPNYYTHAGGTRSSLPRSAWAAVKRCILSAAFGYDMLARGWRAGLGRLLSHISPLRHLAGAQVAWLRCAWRGRLLDVGCGSGEFAAMMAALGWDVVGLEPDVRAARIARREAGIAVVCSRLEEAPFAEASFDVVTLSHVIEHLANPVDALRTLRRLVRAGGKVVVITPNAKSLGHRVFRAHWRDLDPPRHLHLLSPQALAKCAARAGLLVDALFTSPRAAWRIWAVSRTIQTSGSCPGADPSATSSRFRIEGLMFQLIEHTADIFRPQVGEEIVAVCRRIA